MATYSSFKRITSDAIVDSTIVADDIAGNTIPAADIANGNVTAPKMSGVVTSAKIANSINLSGKTVSYRAITDSDVSGSANIAGAKLASGAATGNLGYTPVNTAGDTMTGQLVVPAGSLSAPSVRGTGSNTGIYFPATNEIAISSNGVQGIYIDSGGRVRRPNHPAFAVVGTAGWLYAGSFGSGGGFFDAKLGSQMGWTIAHQTGGSNFNTSNGRYTAPVTGWYVFHTLYYLLNDNNSTSSYIHCFFEKNQNQGQGVGGRSPYTINMHGNRINYDPGANYSIVMQMNAGDYCNLSVKWHSTNSRLHAGHQVWSGHLIG